MQTSGPLQITTRAQMRAYLGGTLAGRRHGWAHLHVRHNSVACAAPCRFCDGAAQPTEGPALFWDADPLCPACAREVAPELALYLAVLTGTIRRLGGDWRALGKKGRR